MHCDCVKPLPCVVNRWQLDSKTLLLTPDQSNLMNNECNKQYFKEKAVLDILSPIVLSKTVTLDPVGCRRLSNGVPFSCGRQLLVCW